MKVLVVGKVRCRVAGAVFNASSFHVGGFGKQGNDDHFQFLQQGSADDTIETGAEYKSIFLLRHESLSPACPQVYSAGT